MTFVLLVVAAWLVLNGAVLALAATLGRRRAGRGAGPAPVVWLGAVRAGTDHRVA